MFDVQDFGPRPYVACALLRINGAPVGKSGGSLEVSSLKFTPRGFSGRIHSLSEWFSMRILLA